VRSSTGTGAAATRAMVRRRVGMVGMCIFGGRWDCLRGRVGMVSGLGRCDTLEVYIFLEYLCGAWLCELTRICNNG
jgi:hypothetical protein